LGCLVQQFGRVALRFDPFAEAWQPAEDDGLVDMGADEEPSAGDKERACRLLLLRGDADSVQVFAQRRVCATGSAARVVVPVLANLVPVQVDDHAIAVDAPVVLGDQKALWVMAQPRLEVIACQRRVAK
jgi:hypothetical protein